MNNDNRYSSHNHHDYDDMDKLKHEHGITDEHGDHKDKHQEHHAGHDHSRRPRFSGRQRGFRCCQGCRQEHS